MRGKELGRCVLYFLMEETKMRPNPAAMLAHDNEIHNIMIIGKS